MVWKIYVHLIIILSLGLRSIICGLFFVISRFTGVSNVIEWELVTINSVCVNFVIIFDWVSLLFICFVLLISRRVIYYRGSYIKGDANFDRFMYLVLMFVFSMIMIVLSPNLISILLGWDGLGLVSYALVIFYQNEKSANAGILTVLSNRIGDVAILLSIGLIVKLGSWNFIFCVYEIRDNNWFIFKFLVILAAITKRAQIPFSAWLPAAMAAPTPVSALVHSSTLVTAGVYLIVRFSPALEGSDIQRILLIVSCLTMFMAGLGANFEYDLKKIIALSTLSQLGVILSILSLGFPDLSFIHLLRHALFKALLFMCAGVIIHRVRGYQDIRCIGCLVKFMPLSVSFMTVANLALCGFPFLRGFYSKDMILEVAFISEINFISLILYVLATGLTVSYTFRLVFYSIRGGFNLRRLRNLEDGDKIIRNSIIILRLRAVFIGSVLSWILFPEPYMICLRKFMKNLVLIIRVLGAGLGYVMNLINVTWNLNSLLNYKIVSIRGSIWFLPFLRTKNVRRVNLERGAVIEKIADKGWYEYMGPQGVYYFLRKLFFVINMLQINGIKVFIKMFLIIVVIVRVGLYI